MADAERPRAGVEFALDGRAAFKRDPNDTSIRPLVRPSLREGLTDEQAVELQAIDATIGRYMNEALASWLEALGRARQTLDRLVQDEPAAAGLAARLPRLEPGSVSTQWSSDPLATLVRRTGVIPGQNLVGPEPIRLGAILVFNEPVAFLDLTACVIELGSINWKGGVQFAMGGGFLTSIVLALATPSLADWHSNTRWNARIEQTMSGGICHSELHAAVDIQHLRDFTTVELDPDRPGLTSQEQKDRICLLQLLLRLNGFSPGAIDGVRGNMTVAAEERFSKEHRLPPRHHHGAPFFDALVDGVRHNYG